MSLKLGAKEGLGMGLMYFFVFFCYALGFWYGTQCVSGSSLCDPKYHNNRPYKSGDVIVIFFSIILAGLNLTQASPAMSCIMSSRIAAARIFEIIDRDPLFEKSKGIRPTTFKGVI